jgi:hypothetical protein
VKALGIDGAWVFAPQIHADDRGSFLEWFRSGELARKVGHRLEVAQGNCSVSRRCCTLSNGAASGVRDQDVALVSRRHGNASRRSRAISAADPPGFDEDLQ